MFKPVAFAAVLSALALPALAQAPTPPISPQMSPEQAMEKAEARLYAAQAEYAAAAARKFQADIATLQKEAADTRAWWAAWWRGMFPTEKK